MSTGTDDRWSLAGLAGFVLSGVMFTIAGVRAGDPFTVIGCVVWITACAIWAVPVVRRTLARAPRR